MPTRLEEKFLLSIKNEMLVRWLLRLLLMFGIGIFPILPSPAHLRPIAVEVPESSLDESSQEHQ